jgi:hypothetical protein
MQLQQRHQQQLAGAAASMLHVRLTLLMTSPKKLPEAALLQLRVQLGVQPGAPQGSRLAPQIAARVMTVSWTLRCSRANNCSHLQASGTRAWWQCCATCSRRHCSRVQQVLMALLLLPLAATAAQQLVTQQARHVRVPVQ